MRKVELHKRAAKYLQKVSPSEKERIKVALKKLETISDHSLDRFRLKGEWKDYYRVRVGDLRILFWYDKIQQIIYVERIGPRGDIYKN